MCATTPRGSHANRWENGASAGAVNDSGANNSSMARRKKSIRPGNTDMRPRLRDIGRPVSMDTARANVSAFSGNAIKSRTRPRMDCRQVMK